MKSKRRIYCYLLIVALVVLNFYFPINLLKSAIPKPNTIKLYIDNEVFEYTKEDKEFSYIYKSCNVSVNPKIYETAIEPDEIASAKQNFCLEYLYNDEQTVSLDDVDKFDFHYNSVFIPLSGYLKGNIIFSTSSDYDYAVKAARKNRYPNLFLYPKLKIKTS